MSFLLCEVRDIPNSGDADGAENEKHNDERDEDFDKRVAGLLRSRRLGNGCRLIGGRRGRTRDRRSGGSWRGWPCWSSTRGASAFSAEGRRVIEWSPTVSAKTSHVCLTEVSLPKHCLWPTASCQKGVRTRKRGLFLRGQIGMAGFFHGTRAPFQHKM
jgi:hypothetical protein